MNNNIKYFSIYLLLIFLWSPFALSEYTYNRIDGNDGAGIGAILHWKKHTGPIPYYINGKGIQTITGEFQAIISGFQTWEQVESSSIEFIFMGCSENIEDQNDGINLITFVDKNWAFDSVAVAVTRNFYFTSSGYKNGEIVDSDILRASHKNKFN